MYFVELTVPWEDVVEAAFKWKKLRYADIAAMVKCRDWRAKVNSAEVGRQGIVAKSVVRLMKDLGIIRQATSQAVKALFGLVEQSSQWLWPNRKYPS